MLGVARYIGSKWLPKWTKNSAPSLAAVSAGYCHFQAKSRTQIDISKKGSLPKVFPFYL